MPLIIVNAEIFLIVMDGKQIMLHILETVDLDSTHIKIKSLLSILVAKAEPESDQTSFVWKFILEMTE